MNGANGAIQRETRCPDSSFRSTLQNQVGPLPTPAVLASATQSSRGVNLGAGLGVGIGVPLFIVFVGVAYYWSFVKSPFADPQQRAAEKQPYIKLRLP